MYKCIHNSTYVIKNVSYENALNLVAFEKIKRKDAHILILHFHPEFVLIVYHRCFDILSFYGVSLSILSNIEIALVNSPIESYNE